MKRIILYDDAYNYRQVVRGKVIRQDPDFFDFIINQSDVREYTRRCYNDYTTGLEHYNNFEKTFYLMRWEPHYYPESHKSTLCSIWFMEKIIGKDVARIIGRIVWESRYDFIWEDSKILK